MMPSRVAEQAKELKAVEEALLGVFGGPSKATI